MCVRHADRLDEAVGRPGCVTYRQRCRLDAAIDEGMRNRNAFSLRAVAEFPLISGVGERLSVGADGIGRDESKSSLLPRYGASGDKSREAFRRDTGLGADERAVTPVGFTAWAIHQVFQRRYARINQRIVEDIVVIAGADGSVCWMMRLPSSVIFWLAGRL